MRRARIAVGAVAVMVAFSSCTGPKSPTCPESDLACPANTACSLDEFGAVCIRGTCGNGVVDFGEACDDGNIIDGDGCSKNCELTCGNGVVDKALGEVCDDGNGVAGDGCSKDCLSTEICGNGIIDTARGEVCDDGNTASGDGCSADCMSGPECGNSSLDLGEECDDGNLRADDNCTAGCRVASCGDGFVNDAGTPDGGHKEYCDDGRETVRCNTDCTWASCGDLRVNLSRGEECDQGAVDTRTCRYDCKLSFCGDGYVNRDAGEACDDATIGTTACPYGAPSCMVCNPSCTGQVTRTGPYCGDFTVDPIPDGGAEACDDSTNGRTVCPYGTPTCTGCNSCTSVVNLTGPFCGDDLIDQLPDGGVEQCDDPSRDAGSCQYGTPTCQACSTSCRFRTLTGPYCGDRNVDALPDGGTELCDDTSTGWTSCPYGTPACIACQADCSGTQALTGPYCGDGTRNGPEACDDGNSSSCGTCSATCGQAQAGSAAIGTITTVGPNNIADGESFTLNDGVNQETFEFDKGDGGTAGRVVVDISSTGNANQVANVVNVSINAENTAGRLTILSSRNLNRLSLTNTQAGSAGNQPIIDNVANAGFTVAGMSGGSAFDCPAGTGCVSDTDCSVGLTCQPTVDGGTCQ